jgi:tartrate dehydratase beta subunit/fumarate hydratase class I family protein
VTEVLDGVKPGDRVVLLGSILTGRTAPPPRLEIADNMKRAPSTGPSTAAATAKTTTVTAAGTAGTAGTPASQAGKPGEARKASKP